MEKHKRTRKLLAVLLSGVLFGAMTLPAMASSPFPLKDEGSTSYNNSTGTYSPVLDSGNTTLEGEIEVQAKTSAGKEIIYNIEVIYGDMRFAHSTGKTWDPTTHTYKGEPGTPDEGWDRTYVDGTKNKIEITNHSNWPIDVDLTYDDSTGTALNADKANETLGWVTGAFATDNSLFLATGVLDAGHGRLPASVYEKDYTGRIHLNMDASGLGANDKYYYTLGREAATLAGTGISETLFFTLTGKPDPNGPTDFVKVGAIKITCTPIAEATRGVKPATP